MTYSWDRQYSTLNTTTDGYGQVGTTLLQPGTTLERTFWSFRCSAPYGNAANFPPGSSLMKVGLIVIDYDATQPYPLTDPSASWLDLVTLHPKVSLSVSTDANWYVQWDTGSTDRDSKVHRMVPATASTSQIVSIAWQFDTATDATWTAAPSAWNATSSCYVNVP